MTEAHPLDAAFAAKARIDRPTYERLYAESVRDAEEFWRRIGKRLDWITPYSKVRDVSFDAADLHIRWFHDGVLNVSSNCLDRHLARHGEGGVEGRQGTGGPRGRGVFGMEKYSLVSLIP